MTLYPLASKGGTFVLKLGLVFIKNPTTNVVGVLILQGRGFEPIAVQHPSGVLLPPVQKLVATLIFFHRVKENANRIPHPL